MDNYLRLGDNLKIEDESSLDDESLVKRSQETPRLFEVFVDRYQPVFLRSATRVLQNKEEAEDAVQSAFLKIYLNANKFQKRPGIEFKSWAFKVLLNCVFTRYRKFKRNVKDSEYLDQLLYSGDVGADSVFDKKERRDEIESVLREMPEDLSRLMREHYLEDMPYAEIASSRSLSIPALKMKLFRARKKFKEVLEGINNK